MEAEKFRALPGRQNVIMRRESPSVFVHGLFGPLNSPATFAEIASGRCSAPDLHGYGTAAGEAVSTAGQIDALRDHIESRYPGERVNVVAHSIGAVYAFALAAERPDLVTSVVTIEGNFSLADAFWSQSIAVMPEDEAETAIKTTLSSPKQWLLDAGVEPSAEHLSRATEALNYQPWRTVRESAIAVVETTSSTTYEATVRAVFETVPVHLVAGERSANDWHVPDWARSLASSATVVPGTGHIVMIEKPGELGRILQCLFN